MRIKTTLADRHVSGLTEIFRLLGEPNRLKLVLACMDEPQAVGALGERLGLSQTLVSHHLRLLRTAHLLRAERDGRQVRYGIDDDHVSAMLRNMIAHLTEPHEHAPDGADDGVPPRPDERRLIQNEESPMSEAVKCACPDCVCKVSPEKAVTKDGKAFCCEECAAGHAHHEGCEHDGCACHG